MHSISYSVGGYKPGFSNNSDCCSLSIEFNVQLARKAGISPVVNRLFSKRQPFAPLLLDCYVNKQPKLFVDNIQSRYKRAGFYGAAPEIRG